MDAAFERATLYRSRLKRLKEMALDAGTGSVRAVIFDLQGKQIAVGQAEWQHLAVPDVPGSME
ncbi:hypothetical protein ONR07_24485, partial [Salmonella enterica subsp. enterica serovar Anatum]|nr:hypothetical protein [Salmonella enterica subsp. enterica serovar Anatum]